MSCNDRNSTTLGELYDFSSGLSKNAKEFGFGFPFLSFKTVFYNSFIPNEIEELANTTDNEQKKCSIQKGDVFLTRTSETLDELGMSCVALKDYPKATFNGFTKRLRPKTKKAIDPKYAGYYFRSQKFRESLTSMATISTRASLNNNILSRLQITLPSFKEQKEIGNILYSLDNRIEFNIRINKILEEMAQAIFKNWFVDFEPFQDGEFEDSEMGMIPKGWNVGTLGEIIQFISGFAFKSSTYSAEGQYKIVTIKNVDDGRFLDIDMNCIYNLPSTIKNSQMLKNGDIIMSLTGNVGRVCMVNGDNYLLNQRVAKLLSPCGLGFLYTLMRGEEMKNTLVQLARGTAQPNLSINDMNRCKLIIPNDETLRSFNEITIPMLKTITELNSEKGLLIKILDTLLPKLMSGEIRVPIEEVK